MSNQGIISTVKGDLAIYLVNIKLGQVLPMINCPPDIDNYVCGENEVKMFVLMCNTETGEFKGIQKLLGYIMVGDSNECFLSYSYDSNKSTVLFSSFKQVLPNIFQSASFKKHNSMLTKEREDSLLFFYLPSTTDRKESIIQYSDHVQLYPIDCLYDNFIKHSSKKEKFMPQDLDSKYTRKRALAREIVVNFFKDAIQISNSNLRRNGKTLLAKGEVKISSDFAWTDERNYQDKFKVTY